MARERPGRIGFKEEGGGSHGFHRVYGDHAGDGMRALVGQLSIMDLI